jgi:hypothetical protein
MIFIRAVKIDGNDPAAIGAGNLGSESARFRCHNNFVFNYFGFQPSLMSPELFI